MNTPLFKQYNNSGDLISLQQVKERITELLGSNEIIFQSEIQDEIENEIQSEIDFYKMQIWCFERGEGGEEHGEGGFDRNKYTCNQIDEDTIWFTTRQEEEIKLLKHQVSKLEDTVALLIRIIKEK